MPYDVVRWINVTSSKFESDILEEYNVTGPVDLLEFPHSDARLIFCAPYGSQFPQYYKDTTVRGSIAAARLYHEVPNLLVDLLNYRAPFEYEMHCNLPTVDGRYPYIDYTTDVPIMPNSLARMTFGDRIVSTLWSIVASCTTQPDSPEKWFDDHYNFNRLKWEIRLAYSLLYGVYEIESGPAREAVIALLSQNVTHRLLFR